MKIGYPCLNLSLGKERSKTFRLASYSEQRLIEAVESNLTYLESMLEYNVAHGLLNFRIFSGVVPFGSHPVCTYDWATHFRSDFRRIGQYMKKHDFRISFHPDQFTLINSPSEEIFDRTIAELTYHTKLLDLFELDSTHKVQIHVGGVYGDKEASKQRFIDRHVLLSSDIKNRLVIENEERLYSLQDCLEISAATHAPILFDVFHHKLWNHGESYSQAFRQFMATWSSRDGVPMIDYSSQDPTKRFGAHAQTIDTVDFEQFLREVKNLDFDIMLEIKDKELSAIKALAVVKETTHDQL